MSEDVVFLSENENSDGGMIITADPEPYNDLNTCQK